MCKKHFSLGALLYAVVARSTAVVRSTFGSQKCLNLTVPDHFLKLGCGFFAKQAQRILDLACQTWENENFAARAVVEEIFPSEMLIITCDPQAGC